MMKKRNQYLLCFILSIVVMFATRYLFEQNILTSSVAFVITILVTMFGNFILSKWSSTHKHN